jgi:hypothetical protein
MKSTGRTFNLIINIALQQAAAPRIQFSSSTVLCSLSRLSLSTLLPSEAISSLSRALAFFDTGGGVYGAILLMAHALNDDAADDEDDGFSSSSASSPLMVSSLS